MSVDRSFCKRKKFSFTFKTNNYLLSFFEQAQDKEVPKTVEVPFRYLIMILPAMRRYANMYIFKILFYSASIKCVQLIVIIEKRYKINVPDNNLNIDSVRNVTNISDLIIKNKNITNIKSSKKNISDKHKKKFSCS